MTTIKINRWSDVFENADMRKRQRLGWFLAPSGSESRGYRKLMRFGRDGLVALGVFQALCQVLATLPKQVRKTGTFLNSDGTAMEIDDLREVTRIEKADFEGAVKLLEEVGWLIIEESQLAQEMPTACRSSASSVPVACHPHPGFVKGEGEGEGEGEASASGMPLADSAESEPAKQIPDSLRSSPEFVTAWADFTAFWSDRFGGGRLIPEQTAVAQLRELIPLGPKTASLWVRNAIRKGLREPCAPLAAPGAKTDSEAQSSAWESRKVAV